MKTKFLFTLIFVGLSTFSVSGFASEDGREFVEKLKSIADQLDYYPLECHVFPLAEKVSWLNTIDFSRYFEFTTLAREATEEDRES